MKKISKYIAMVALGAATLLFGSCHGTPDDPIDEPTDPKTEVPDGVLRIFADKTTITANGSDVVTFTAMLGKEDVSTAKTFQLFRTSLGKETPMPYGVNSFSTVVPGEYTFRAEYYRAGRYYSDNEVLVVAESSGVVGEQKDYAQNVLGFQFTSVGCVNCPTLSANIKVIEEEMPGVMIPVSFHRDFNMTDPMTHPMTDAYYKKIKRDGLPQFNANLIIEDRYITVSSYSDMVEMINSVSTEYPATCGVAIESSLEPNYSGMHQLDVNVKVTSNTESAYRYQVFLVEDGIEEYQEGAGGDYKHNNVVRVCLSDSVYGNVLNEGAPFQTGVEVSKTSTLTIPETCKVDNMRVVVAVFCSYDGGSTFIVNNCAQCPVGESVDYELK